MDLSPRYFLLLILRIATILLALLHVERVIAADYQWCSSFFGRCSFSPGTLCGPTPAGIGASGRYTLDASLTSGYCTGSGGGVIPNSYFTRSGDTCPAGRTYNSSTGVCETPAPPVCGPDEFEGPGGSCLPKSKCPPKSSFDANMNGGEGGCSCQSGSSMVKLDGFSMCMDQLGNDACTPSSPDFAGYINGYAACPGRNRCPNGTKPGFVGSGDQMQAVCYPEPQDPNCNGASGVVNGEAVCIPVISPDPNCPMGSGVINGDTVCIADPNNDPDCPGGVAGYYGPGDQLVKTCVSPDYKPPTCPPGQYTLGLNGEGFGCVTASPTPPKDPDTPPKPGQTLTITPGTGGAGGDGGSGGDGGAGGAGGSVTLPEGGLEMTIDGLFQDAPNDNFKKDLDEFGQSELDGVLNPDLHFNDVRGPDGLFTERSSLDNLASFVKSNTVGNSTSCNGALPFMGMTVSCEKFATYNRILGYMFAVFSIIAIYKTIMRPSASGV